MEVITGTDLPPNPSEDSVYVLIPRNFDLALYRERTDRNIGWISFEEQEMLRGKTVGIAGCGGMGGLVISTLLRAGIGALKIADLDTFDISNINRQLGATRSTVGVSKAFGTAQALRDICDDITITVYPRGINENDVDHFLEGCDIVLDEVEFWAVGARILLHQRARAKGIPLINGVPVGFGTRLFLFTPQGTTMEQCLELDYAEAKVFEQKLRSGTVTTADRARVQGAVFLGLIPEIPSYCPKSESVGHPAAARRRLVEEAKTPVIATNLPMASGFMANHVVLQLLKNSGVKRKFTEIPDPPGYLYLDAARMKAYARAANPLFRLRYRLKIKMLEIAANRMAKKAV